MKVLKYFLMVVLTVCLASCGSKNRSGSKESFDVTVDNTTIGGKLSQYFSLEDKTYKYQKVEEGPWEHDNVTVELKCIQPLPENLKAYIGVEVLDENGTVISAGKADYNSFNDYEVLRQATPGQVVTVKIINCESLGENTPAKIRLSSIVEEVEEVHSGSISSSEDSEESSVSSDDSSDEESSDDEESISSSSSGSQDWDALLNSYEQYVDKYISYMKKAAKGDMSALAEYPVLMEKAQEFSEKMENAQGDMSASQWARYMKITTKMTTAAQEMR